MKLRKCSNMLFTDATVTNDNNNNCISNCCSNALQEIIASCAETCVASLMMRRVKLGPHDSLATTRALALCIAFNFVNETQMKTTGCH